MAEIDRDNKIQNYVYEDTFAASGLGFVVSTRYLCSRGSCCRFIPSASSLPTSHSKEVGLSLLLSAGLGPTMFLFFHCIMEVAEILLLLVAVSYPGEGALVID